VLSALLRNTQDTYIAQTAALVTALHDLMGSLQNNESDAGLLETILTTMTDLCEYSHQGREKFAGSVLDIFKEKMSHQSPGVRQISTFGIGVIAQKAPEVLKPKLFEILPELTRVIIASRPQEGSAKEMDSDDGMALDNAVSAYCKILSMYMATLEDNDKRAMYKLWMSCLPLRHDLDEARSSHSFFIDRASSQDPFLLGKASVPV